jgi:hypothetical protein
MHPVKWLVCAVVVAASLALPSLASAQTAEIVGRVTDNTGGVLPGATVTVENNGTRDVRTAVTSETGDYVFTLLPIGTYTVRIELQGFSAFSSRAVLTSGDRTRIDGKLNVGVVSETVEVTAEAPLLQTDASTLRTLVTEKAVQDLPISGRNFVNLVSMVPGATPTNGAPGGNNNDRRQTSAVSINGGDGTGNNHLIDGMDNNERYIGTIGVKPSMDAIQEIRVETNLYSAESGRTGGGVINILTKSGTNAFHGSAYEFYRNDRFDERDYFATIDPILNQHQFGGSIGGPIVSNRTFFFGDYERLNSTSGQVNNLTIPTLKMRQGDFSEVSGQIFDPFTSPRVAFPNNQIPANRIDPIAARYMALYPAPTTSGLANNYQSTTEGLHRTNTADVRLDHRIDASNTIWGRWSYNDLDNYNPAGCPPDPATGISPGCTVGTNNAVGPHRTTAAGYQANYVRVFSPTLVGEFKGGVMNLALESFAANRDQPNLSAAFGLPGVNVDDIATGLALMNMTGFAVLGDSQNLPNSIKNSTKQINGVLTKTTGAHSFKFGAGIILREVTNAQSSSPNGIFAFNANLTRSTTGAGGHSVASFLLGTPTSITRNHAPFTPYYHSNEPYGFVQDDWRATDRLTLNFGLRYDLATPFTEKNDLLSNLDPFEGKLYVAGRDGASRTAGVKTDYSNIQPRFGFAATLPRQIVVRGGYGWSFIPANRSSFATMKNFPLAVAYAPTSLGNNLGGIPDLLLRNGLPPIDLPSTVPAPRALEGSFRAVDVNARSTRYQQFNVNLEKEFAGNVATIGYVGSLGDFEPGGNNQNLDMAPVGLGPLQPRRIFNATLPGLTTINYFTTRYESSYHAMQLVFQRRFREGLSVSTHYTRSVSKNSQPLPWAIVDPVTLEFTDETREWTYSAGDRPHKWVAQANYALPWGRDLGGVAGSLIAGWQVNVSTFWMSGSPWGVTNSTDRANVGPTNGNDRPNLVGDPILSGSERTLDRWFNTAAFEAQPLGTVGDAPATVGWAPSQRRTDLSLFKDISLSGNNRLQLRYEVFNVLNTANFAAPNTSLGNSNFGRISSTSGIPRQMQFAAKFLF